MSQKNNDDYKDGYNSGKEAGWMDQISHNLSDFVPGPDNKSYDAGWKDGIDDKNDDSNSHYRGGSDDGGGGGCFVTSACVTAKNLPDNCVELETLRKFRNEYVLTLPEGETLNKEYKRIAPQIVEKINQNSDALNIYNDIYSEITNMIYLINKNENKLALASYKSMVINLSSKFNVN